LYISGNGNECPPQVSYLLKLSDAECIMSVYKRDFSDCCDGYVY